MGPTPDYSGDVSSGSRGAGIPPAPVTEAAPTTPVEKTPADIANQSDIGRSTSSPIIIDFVASQPNLMISTGQSIYSKAVKDIPTSTLAQLTKALANSYNEAMNAVLDNWSKQIALQGEIAQKNAIEQSIQDANQSYQRTQDDSKKASIESSQLAQSVVEQSQLTDEITRPTLHKSHLNAGAFIDNLQKASSTERLRITGQLSKDIVNQINREPGNLSIELQDAQKVVPYAAAAVVNSYLTEVLVINPLAADIALRDTNPNAISAQLQQINAVGIDATQQINLLLPSMYIMYSSAEDTALSLKQKYDGADTKPSRDNIDEEFVKKFATSTLDRVKNMDSWMHFKDPNYALLPTDQQQAVAAGASLIALTTVLVLDTKSQAEFSNLSPEEFKSILSNGIPDHKELNDVAGTINSILRQFSPDDRVDYVNMLLDYIDKAPKMNTNDLKEFSTALLYATEEIGTDIRAVNQPS